MIKQLPFFVLLVMLLSGFGYGQSTCRWQTTRLQYQQGGCRLVAGHLKVIINPLSVDVEEEVEIAPTGMMSGGDSSTLEITGRVTLSPGTAVRSLLLWNGNTLLKARLKDRTVADNEYEEVVDRQRPVVVARDPMIIEYLGNNQYQYRIYPVAFNASRKLRILYTVPMTPSSQQLSFRITPAFICAPQNIGPENIPVEFQFNSSQQSHYVFEMNGKKRDVQTGSVYMIPYLQLFEQQNYWNPKTGVPICLIGDTVTSPFALSSTVSSGNKKGRYLALFAPLPDSIRNLIGGEYIGNVTVEAIITAGGKKYIVEVTDKKLIATYIKTSSEWNQEIGWNVYDYTGEKIFDVIQTVPVEDMAADDGLLPFVWGAKYSLLEETEDLGAIFGFVDRKMSLLVLEGDSIPADEAKEYKNSGVPILTDDEIIVGKDGAPELPDDNILFEYGTSVRAAPSDHTKTVSIALLPNGMLRIISDKLHAGKHFALYLFSLNGRVVYKTTGTISELQTLSLLPPQNLRGTYLLDLRSDGHRIRQKVTLR